MRTIIAGSRNLGYEDVCIAMENALKYLKFPSIVISGNASGVDRAGELWAFNNGVTVETFPADWERFGRTAGMVRNRIMADSAEQLVAVWDGKSKGTENMINIATKKGLLVYIHKVGK